MDSLAAQLSFVQAGALASFKSSFRRRASSNFKTFFSSFHPSFHAGHVWEHNLKDTHKCFADRFSIRTSGLRAGLPPEHKSCAQVYLKKISVAYNLLRTGFISQHQGCAQFSPNDTSAAHGLLLKTIRLRTVVP